MNKPTYDDTMHAILESDRLEARRMAHRAMHKQSQSPEDEFEAIYFKLSKPWDVNLDDTIFDYFTKMLQVEPNDDTLKELPVDSECGKDCKRIINAGKCLLDCVDQSVEDDVRSAVESAIGVSWRG